MRLLCSKYNINLRLEENKVTVISVENPVIFSEVLAELWNQVNGKEGEFVLSETDKILNMSKLLELIINPFSVNCNDRKILSKLYQELNEIALDTLYENTAKLNEWIVEYIENLTSLVPYHLKSALDLNLSNLLKAYDVEIDVTFTTLSDKLVDYLRIMHQICHKEIFIFVNLKNYFSNEQLCELYKFAFYEKLYLVNIEGQFSGKNGDEKCWILDKDLCIIEVE